MTVVRKIRCICKMRELFQALSLLEGQLVSGYGITLNEAVVLCSVGDGSVLAGTIAGCTGMSPSHASKIISHVEKKGLLERKVAESDKRCMYFTLTPEGRRLLHAIDARGVEVPSSLEFFFTGD